MSLANSYDTRPEILLTNHESTNLGPIHQIYCNLISQHTSGSIQLEGMSRLAHLSHKHSKQIGTSRRFSWAGCKHSECNQRRGWIRTLSHIQSLFLFSLSSDRGRHSVKVKTHSLLFSSGISSPSWVGLLSTLDFSINQTYSLRSLLPMSLSHILQCWTLPWTSTNYISLIYITPKPALLSQHLAFSIITI